MAVCFFNHNENKYLQFETMEELVKERRKLVEKGVKLGNNEIVGLVKIHNYYTFKAYKESGKPVKNPYQEFSVMESAVDSFFEEIEERDSEMYYAVGVGYMVGGDPYPYSTDLYNCTDNIEKVCNDYLNHKKNGDSNKFHPLEYEVSKVVDYIQEKQPLKLVIWDAGESI